MLSARPPRRRGAALAALATLATTLALTVASLSPATSATTPARASATTPAATGHGQAAGPPRLLASGLGGTVGSTVGPDGRLYVADGLSGTVLRVDRRTGATRVVGRGLPTRVSGVPIGGAMDLAFLHGRLYALVTMVSPDLGGTSADGVYRVGRHHSRLVADVGAFALAHPPATDFFVPTGVQYSLLAHRGAFLVSDGHHNRVYRVTLRGGVSEAVTFGDLVPTGLARRGRHVYLTQAGPVPHLPETGKALRLHLRSHTATEIASGARLAVGLGFSGHRLYVLSQGYFVPGQDDGAPAEPGTGQLFRATHHGLVSVADGLNQPTSVEIVGRTAYVVTLSGEVWTVRLRRH